MSGYAVSGVIRRKDVTPIRRSGKSAWDHVTPWAREADLAARARAVVIPPSAVMTGAAAGLPRTVAATPKFQVATSAFTPVRSGGVAPR